MPARLTTITKSAGWARTDVIYQLEEAFSILGWHGGTLSGIVTGISAYSGGGTLVGSSSTDYHDVFQSSTSGIGTGASFYVDRSSGNIANVYVNRPGYGYTHGEVVQLSANDIGGSVSGAVGMAVTVWVAGGASPIGYGTTNQFYDKDVIPGSASPWGVLRNPVQANKRFGDAYRHFQTGSTTNLYISSGSGFHPWDIANNTNRGNGLQNRFAGAQYLDVGWNPITGYAYTSASNIADGYPQWFGAFVTYCSSQLYRLDLNIYRSDIDPNFAVFSYRQPTLSSVKLRDNTFGTFIIHDFTTSLWDYDDVFLGGVTTITPSTDETNPFLEFRTYCSGNMQQSTGGEVTKRCAEYGFTQGSGNGTAAYKSTFYVSNSYPRNSSDTYPRTGLYVRNNDVTSHRGRGGDNSITGMSTTSNYNAVIKGIPINAQFVPIPYYMPDEFVLIDFDYAIPSANILQGDTITISGSEVYTVITGSYNQTTRTRGILFCARTT